MRGEGGVIRPSTATTHLTLYLAQHSSLKDIFSGLSQMSSPFPAAAKFDFIVRIKLKIYWRSRRGGGG